MRGKRSTPLVSSRPAIIWFTRLCELSETIPHPLQLYTLSLSPPMRGNSLPRSSPRSTKTILMCFHMKRLRTCLLIAGSTMKFTLRTIRLPLTAISIHSLAQSSVSFRNSWMICLAKVSSTHHSCQPAHPSSSPRKGWYSAALHRLPKPQQNHPQGSVPDPPHH